MFPSARADKSLFIAYGLHPGTRIAALTTDAEMVNSIKLGRFDIADPVIHCATASIQHSQE